MQIVDTSAMEWSGQEEKHRTGALRFKSLFKGEEGNPNNFRWVLARADGDYVSPRHRHNFDQVRFCLEGSANIGPGKDLHVGDVGYFPEGTYYGPQQDLASQRVVLVLQSGGASGLGYMSAAQLRAGQQQLEKLGTFARGRFCFHGEPEARSRDSYEAIWEHVFGRPIEYPRQRYDEPIIMRTASFDWSPDAERQGIWRKLLGVFTERGTQIEMIRVDAGAAVQLGRTGATVLAFMVEGNGNVDGKKMSRESAMRIDRGETVELQTAEGAEVFALTLPII